MLYCLLFSQKKLLIRILFVLFLLCFFFARPTVPEAAPYGMEAIQFNRTSVFLKWLPPQPNRTRNGTYQTNP